jgi:hypothetical protein
MRMRIRLVIMSFTRRSIALSAQHNFDCYWTSHTHMREILLTAAAGARIEEFGT